MIRKVSPTAIAFSMYTGSSAPGGEVQICRGKLIELAENRMSGIMPDAPNVEALAAAKTKIMEYVLDAQDLVIFDKEIEDPPKMVRDLKLKLKQLTDSVLKK